MSLPPFLICIHDITPAYARETRAIIDALAPLVGRRFSVGVVPDWHGRWPLHQHRDYCRFIQGASEEILLHGYTHQRARGWGPATWLAERSDEMSGLDADEMQRTVERGQRVFTDVFGGPARGFLPPAWQAGHVHAGLKNDGAVEHVIGFFSLRSYTGRIIPLATWTWDCGRWGWLGHVGHQMGALQFAAKRGVPTLAIHPRDLERGFWPRIVRVIEELLAAGYEPRTSAGVLEAM